MTKEQWEAIKSHDPACDGKFFYALKTARTICRPSCTARKCKPENVIIFDTLEEGIQAGFHSCARCRPDLPEWRGAKQELAERAKAYIQTHFTEKFSLEQMAKALFVDKIYLSKCFKEVTGATLLQYHNHMRCEEACRLLTDQELSVEFISGKVGYVTSSHFARIFRGIYQCSPTEYRKNYLNSLN